MANLLPSVFTGPALALPRHLDQVAERWARLPWRLRAALLICLGLTLMCWHTNRVNNVKAALGAIQHVWVATETLTPGSDTAGKFKRTAVPAAIRPAEAVSDEPTASPVLTIVAGTVATSVHFEGVDKAPSVPAGHRAIAIATSDADLFAPGSRVDLWDLSGDEPGLLVEQLIVVSVKAQRVIVGVPDATASAVVQRASSNHLRVAPAGVVDKTPSHASTRQPSDVDAELIPIKAPGSQAVVPPTPKPTTLNTPRAERSIDSPGSSGFTSEDPDAAHHEVRGVRRDQTRNSHALRILKPP